MQFEPHLQCYGGVMTHEHDKGWNTLSETWLLQAFHFTKYYK